ncbi:MAG: hypothetical protein RMJ67_01390 [Elusimicrobiota bacterium]|nr:hypothetical protein [Endomicrobiia bacterium]MDW8165158.1 hypothetical protein [Elusimicrobiota bacterium]
MIIVDTTKRKILSMRVARNGKLLVEITDNSSSSNDNTNNRILFFLLLPETIFLKKLIETYMKNSKKMKKNVNIQITSYNGYSLFISFMSSNGKTNFAIVIKDKNDNNIVFLISTINVIRMHAYAEACIIHASNFYSSPSNYKSNIEVKQEEKQSDLLEDDDIPF